METQISNATLLERQPLSVECHGRDDLTRLEREWPALLARTGHEAPFYRHDFMRVWLDNFAPGEPVHLITVRDGAGLRAALCLVERRRWFRGVPVRMLCGAAGIFSERFDLLANPDDHEAIAAVWSHLRDALPWHVIELPEVPASDTGGEGAAHRLLARAALDGPTGVWESKEARYIPLARGDQAGGGELSAKFKRSLRSRQKRAAARGELTFERVTAAGLELDAYLEEGFALEASGWKGAAHTAIASEPRLRAYYTELARTAQAHGYLSLSFLRSKGKAIAFHFSLASHGRTYLLKVARDEAWDDCAPGHLLLGEAVRDGVARGDVELDFLGPDMPWKQEWTKATRAHGWLYAFRDDWLGRALHAAKFRVPSWLRSAARA